MLFESGRFFISREGLLQVLMLMFWTFYALRLLKRANHISRFDHICTYIKEDEMVVHLVTVRLTAFNLKNVNKFQHPSFDQSDEDQAQEVQFCTPLVLAL